MFRNVVGGAVLALAGATPVAVSAQDSPWSLTATAATEYVSKGAGKSDEEPHASLGLERAFGTAFAGAWAGNVKTSQGADAEIHLYVGAKPKLGDVQLDLRAIYKTLPGTRAGLQEDHMEFRVDATRSFGRVKLRQRIEYAPDSYAATEAAWWMETQASTALNDAWTASAAIARREQDNSLDYTAWNLGARWAISDRFDLDLRWYDTNKGERGDQYEGRAVAALTAKF